ncbi:DUF3846 domain-containing protein [Kineosporia sp. NBRC 101677]|uniref:DUF3846 domain-containing protein n=1 Tax=Kineosporia sp. NBRC 101677 TaxID=3032197 RepID=UPI0025541832|nr:DUF3846 domain-containing protein [Kineosporia sp. NBRC 101677]
MVGDGAPHGGGAGSGEQMLAVVIPVDLDEPIRLEQVPLERGARTQAFHTWVDGNFEVLHLDEPQASLYCNEEGKILAMPVNQRATSLLWVHNPLFHGRDVVNGPAFLVGPVDEAGEDTTAPAEMVNLTVATGTWQVQAALSEPAPDGTLQWQLLSTHTQWFAAYWWANFLHPRFPVRVVSAVEEELLAFWQFTAAMLVHHEGNWVGDGSEVPLLACRDLSDLATQVRLAGPESGQAFTWRDLCLLYSGSVGGSERWTAVRYDRATTTPSPRGLTQEELGGWLEYLAALTAEEWRSEL